MTEPRYYRWLHEALARDATVITSSRRLARELHLEFAEHQAASGKNAWATPDIYFWQDWLSRSLEELPDSKLPRLIDAASSAVLWEQCLAQTIRDELLSASGLVRHAMRAWQRIHEWQVPLDALAETAASRDEHWFARAADAYAEKLQQSQWLDPAQLPEFCAALIASGSIPAPA